MKAVSAAVTAGTAGTISGVGVPDIIQGTTGLTRNGDIIHIKSLSIRAFPVDNAPAAYRFVLFIDRLAQGTTPSVTDVLASASPYAQYSSLNVIGHGGARFKVLADKTFTINPQITATNTYGPFYIANYKGAVAMPVVYTASTGAASDVSKNNVWLLSISSTASAYHYYSTAIEYVDN